MATYSELRDLFDEDEFKNKIDIAVVVAANNLLSGTPTLAQQQWAAKVFEDPRSEGKKAVMAVLAANRNATVSQILGATDSAIQTNVDAVVDSLVTAFTG